MRSRISCILINVSSSPLVISTSPVHWNCSVPIAAIRQTSSTVFHVHTSTVCSDFARMFGRCCGCCFHNCRSIIHRSPRSIMNPIIVSIGWWRISFNCLRSTGLIRRSNSPRLCVHIALLEQNQTYLYWVLFRVIYRENEYIDRKLFSVDSGEVTRSKSTRESAENRRQCTLV